MNNAINMLPCPMCGCSSINVKNEQPTDNSGGYFIECPDCGISTSLRYACGDDPIPLLAEQWNRRATTQCLHQIAEPAAISEGEAFQALSELTNALRERHYGRMPSEVQAAYDKAWTIVFAGEKRAPVTQQAPAHPDDAAVDALAALMKAKLTEKRAKGYGGWNDKTQCPQQRLSDMLRAHVDKGDPVDVANFCAMLSARGEGIAAAPQAVQAAVPLFWVRLLRDGLYEGPVHNNSVGGKMLRDEKPGEWHPLYLHTAPAHPAEGVPATIRMLDDRAAFEASVQKEHYWEGIRENLFDRLPSGKYAVVGIERHWQTWMAALAGTQPAAPQAVQDAVPDGWRDQLEQALCDLQTSPYPATAVAVKRIEKLLAAAPAHPAEGVPAQSYVADFFREKGFYPSLAQAFAAGVAHAAAMPAQTVDEIMELADEYAGAQACAVTATSTADADTTKERNALLSAIRAALAATQPAAQGMDSQTIKHVSALSELVRMPNAEHFADAHNAAVRHLRALAGQAKQGGASNDAS